MKKQKVNKKLLFLVAYFALFSLFQLAFSTKSVVADSWPDGQSEADIYGGHIHAKITYVKDGNPNYTAIGDTITVTTVLEKKDDTNLEEEYKQSTLVTVFPDKEQGLELLGEPELVYKHGGVTGNGNLMAPSKEVAYDIITAYNFYGHTEFGDSKSYDGRITEILPLASDGISDGPYSDNYSVYRLLEKTGDSMTITYRAKVTEKAANTDKFVLRASVWDSMKKDIGFTHFLSAEMPSFQSEKLALSFDDTSKNLELDSEQTTLTGKWSGPLNDLTAYLTINGMIMNTDELLSCFKSDGTFRVPVDLSQLPSVSEVNNVTLMIQKSNGESAQDSTVLRMTKPASPPTIELANHLANQTLVLYPGDQGFTLSGKWKADSGSWINIYYKLNGVEKKLNDSDSIANTQPGDMVDFSKNFTLADLAAGENQFEVYVKNEKQQQSNIETFKVIKEAGGVRFVNVPDLLTFMSIPVTSHTIQTNLTQAANLLVEDTTGKPINWKLNVSQTEEFKDGKQVLPATLFYQNGDTAQVIEKEHPIALPMTEVTTNNNARNYSILQNSQNYFYLNVQPGGYAGEYSSQVEWTIVNAP